MKKTTAHKESKILKPIYHWVCWLRVVAFLGNAKFPYCVNTALIDKALIVNSWSMASKPSLSKEKRIRELIKDGANVEVGNWHAFRMAACGGHLDLMSWLSTVSMPSPQAISDAISWASYNRHTQVLEWLNNAFNLTPNGTVVLIEK